MRDSRIGARQRVGGYPQSQTRRSSGQAVTTADGPPTRRVALLAIWTTSSRGAARGCFGVATSMWPFPPAPRAALGRLVGRAADNRARARESSLSRGPPGCIRSARAGGATGSDGDCDARAGEGAVWVPTSSQTIARRYRRLRPGADARLHGRRRLPAIRIRCSADTQGAGRARHIQVCVQIAAGRACCHRSAPDLHRVGSLRRRPSALQKVRRFR